MFSVDVIFVTCQPANQRHLQFQTFLNALAIVAKEAGLTFEEVASKLGCRGAKPANSNSGPRNSSCATSVQSESCSVSESFHMASNPRYMDRSTPASCVTAPACGDEALVMRAVEHVLRVIKPREGLVADRLQRMELQLSGGKENSLPFPSENGASNKAPNVAAVVR